MADADVVLGVLEAVERNRFVTQRSMASDLGIALGLANTYLKRCVKKGLVKVSEVPRRRYAYYLTPQGFTEKSRLTAQYLSASLSFFRRARAQLSEIFAEAAARSQRRLVLIGEGDIAEIAKLVGRDLDTDLVSILPVSTDPEQIRQLCHGLGSLDACVVTAMEMPREVFHAAVEVFGADRVHAPRLLRIHAPALAVNVVAGPSAEMEI